MRTTLTNMAASKESVSSGKDNNTFINNKN